MELTSTTNMEERLNKDGKFEMVKTQDAMQVFYIKSLSFDGTTLHHEGVMLLTEPKSHNKNKPIYYPIGTRTRKYSRNLKSQRSR